MIIDLLNEGYTVLKHVKADYNAKRTSTTYDPGRDNVQCRAAVANWTNNAIRVLNSIFPTELEASRFANPKVSALHEAGVNADFSGITNHLKGLIEALDTIRTSSLEQYTDLPIKARLYVEDIDCFRKARDVNWADVNDLLDDNGRLDRSEQDVKDLFEHISANAYTRRIGAAKSTICIRPIFSSRERAVTEPFSLKATDYARPLCKLSIAERMAIKFSDYRSRQRGSSSSNMLATSPKPSLMTLP